LNDLQSNTVAQYNWITPNQFNDMHTTLSGGYTPLGGGPVLTGDDGRIARATTFFISSFPSSWLRRLIRTTERLYCGGTNREGDGVAGDNADDFNHTIPEIVISPDAFERQWTPLRKLA
jgi:hypothetical protein